MKTTEHLGLNKPESSDYYNIETQNSNMETIDNKMKTQDERLESQETKTETLRSEMDQLPFEYIAKEPILLSSEDNLNDFETVGQTYYWKDSKPENAPLNYGFMFVIKEGQPKQVVICNQENDIYIRRRTGGTWPETWTQVATNKNINDLHNHDTAYAPIGFGLGTDCINIGGQDLNDDRKTGFYMGTNMINAPSVKWHYIMILRHNDKYMTQILYPLNTDEPIYWRNKVNGSWGAYNKVWDSKNFDPDTCVKKEVGGQKVGSYLTVVQNGNHSVLELERSNGNYASHYYVDCVNNYAAIGVFDENGTNRKDLIMAQAGDFTWAGKTIWHAGNLTPASYARIDSVNEFSGKQSTNHHIVSGRGSGGVALTINDGQGNANLTFNHEGGTPEQDGNAMRITTNTDATTDATMDFALKSGVEKDVTVVLDTVLRLTEEAVQPQKKLIAHNNSEYTTAQTRNIFFGTADPADIDIVNGGIYIQVESM